MNKYISEFTLCAGAIGGFFAQAFGGWDVLLQTIIWLIILDYVTGILKGIYNKNLSSEVGYKGIIKKVMMLIIIALACSLQLSIDTSIPIREIVITFFIANEGLSIIENAIGMGIPFPKKVVDLLEQLRSQSNGDKNEDSN